MWELHLNMELEHLRIAADLMRRHDNREPEEIVGQQLLSVVDFVHEVFIGVVDDWGVRKPRPVVVGGALVGLVMGCSVW